MNDKLIVVEKTDIATVFNEGGMLPIIDRIKAEVGEHVFDVTTAKGRKDCASLAHTVARSKTYLDGLGKDYASELKKAAKLIDGERKIARDELDALRDKIRKPLNEWDLVESKRVAAHQANIEWLVNAGKTCSENWPNLTIDQMVEKLSKFENLEIDDAWQEFQESAKAAQTLATAEIKLAIDKRQEHDRLEAENARIQAEKAERERIERDEKMRLEGEERARLEAETMAKQAAEDQIETQRQAIADAEQRAADAEKEAEEKAEAAAKAERERIEAEQKQAEKEAQEREANTEHNRKVNTAAAKSLVDHSMSLDHGEIRPLTLDQAKIIVTAIAKGQITGVSIQY